jgi:hypothetical protein
VVGVQKDDIFLCEDAEHQSADWIGLELKQALRHLAQAVLGQEILAEEDLEARQHPRDESGRTMQGKGAPKSYKIP